MYHKCSCAKGVQWILGEMFLFAKKKEKKRNSENTEIPEGIAIIFSFSGFVFFLYAVLERRNLKYIMFSFFHADLLGLSASFFVFF